MNGSENILRFQSKILLIQAFDETGAYDSGPNAIDASKHFIRNNKKMIDGYKNRFKTLLNLIEKIYKIKLKPERYSLLDIERLLNENRKLNSSNITWYELKLTALSNIYSSERILFKTF